MTDPEPEGNDRPNWETRAETGLPTDLELMISRLEDMMITDDGRIGGALLSLPNEKLLDLEGQVGRIQAAIRSARNELAPVNRLPPELLVKIFEAREEEKDLVAAICVCARWCETLVSTPHLWTKIDFEHLDDLAYSYLEWSKEEHIDVIFGKRSRTHGSKSKLIGQTSWLSRMKSLCIQRDVKHIEVIVEWLCRAAPNLQSLTIEGRDLPYPYSEDIIASGNFYLHPDFLGRSAPSLQRLRFLSVSPCTIFTFPLPALTHIDWVAPTTYVAIEELLNLFATSPLLEVITMHAQVGRTGGPMREITLNELRKLDWADYDGWTSPVPCLTAPKLRELTIRVTSGPEYQWTVPPSILSSDEDRIPLLQEEPTALEYVYDTRTKQSSGFFLYPGNAFLYVVEATMDSKINPIIHWPSPSLANPFSSTQKLTVEVIGGCPPLGDLPIEKSGGLRSLTLRGEVDLLIPLIQLDDASDGTPAPFPDLSEVKIALIPPRSTLSKLTKVLGERARAGHRVNTFRMFNSPPDGYTDADLEELREVVDVVVTSAY